MCGEEELAVRAEECASIKLPLNACSGNVITEKKKIRRGSTGQISGAAAGGEQPSVHLMVERRGLSHSGGNGPERTVTLKSHRRKS